ncbi:Trigger factor [Desulfurobacterium thermolithotrophum DSM 11699]|uniref:Trigger factor n=1 Tax=Desulfurobacterium thermolithotrophum (strain DSM 11699 / BSA) TaxID=868864 RepID=F0S4A1_DESTD|nr:trigger factor [Desulfurobacterium thermolithotrophum]ADY73673.1 Trigger factor [Desulfurobacterium thermolithotrophum DSM 11699]
MAYEVEKRNEVLYAVKISAEPTELEKEVNEICKEIKKTAKIPGFRPGKAPINIIKKYYEETIRDALLRNFVPEKLSEAIKENNLQVISELVVEALDFSLKENKFSTTVLFEVKPAIELKPEDYKGIKATKTIREITDEDVEKVIEGLRNQQAQFNEVDREAREGDLVDIEYETIVKGDEKEEPQKGSVSVILGQNQLWPEIEKEVLGKKAGEEGEVSFTAPEDEKIYGEAAGKEITVKFKISAVKEKILPELNDEFAKKFGFENLEDMKKKIRENLEKSEKEREQEEVEDQIVDELLKKVNIPVPQSMLDLEIRAQAENQLAKLAQFGVDVRQMNPQTLVEMVRPTAEKTVKVKLLLEKVAELEGLEVTDEDLDAEIQKLAEAAFNGDYVQARQSLEERGLLGMIKQDVLRQKALDRLIELAEVEEVPAEKTNKPEE